MEKFTKGKAVGLDEGKVTVASDREADGANSRIEVEDTLGRDVFFNFG